MKEDLRAYFLKNARFIKNIFFRKTIGFLGLLLYLGVYGQEKASPLEIDLLAIEKNHG